MTNLDQTRRTPLRRLRRSATTLLLAIAISATEVDGRATVKRAEEIVLIMPRPKHYPPRSLPWRMRWSGFL